MSGVQQAVFQNQRSFGPAPGQDAYTTAGNYTWVAPTAVTSVSVVAIGGGANRGGSLGYKNNISTTPGSSYTVVVGNENATSRFVCTVKGSGGCVSCAPFYVGDGGGYGGGVNNPGGGGAGGYSGNGGTGTGGSGGNGGAYSCGCTGAYGQAGGGGVGILGQGASGANGITYCRPGKGGSGGANGTNISGNVNGGNGGAYGGGGGQASNSPGAGAAGAVRIIWPGNTRSFPSTCTGDL